MPRPILLYAVSPPLYSENPMERVVAVRCSLPNGSVDQTMSVTSVEDLLQRVDRLVADMRRESPTGNGSFAFVYPLPTNFDVLIYEGKSPSETILFWERHILECYLEDKEPVRKVSDDWPDEVDDESEGPQDESGEEWKK